MGDLTNFLWRRSQISAFEYIEIGLLLFVGILAASTLRSRKVRPEAGAEATRDAARRGQPVLEASPTTSTWTEPGLRDLQGKGFYLVRVVAADSLNLAEYSLRDVNDVELGSIVFWNASRATIAWHGRQYVKYSQLAGSIPTEYSGKVGGTSNRSIIVHDDSEAVVAEIDPLRDGLEFSYTIQSNGVAYAVAGPTPFDPLDRALNTVLRLGETVAAYQAYKLGGLAEYVAFKDELPDPACVAVIVCSLLR